MLVLCWIKKAEKKSGIAEFCVPFFMTLEEELGKVQEMKFVVVCLNYNPVKWFWKIIFEEEDMTLWMGLVWIKFQWTILNFMSNLHDLRNWIRETNKHEKCSFLS